MWGNALTFGIPAAKVSHTEVQQLDVIIELTHTFKFPEVFGFSLSLRVIDVERKVDVGDVERPCRFGRVCNLE